MSLGTKLKDQRDVRQFSFDWSAELGAETIATSDFAISPAGLTNGGDGIVAGGKKTTIKLSGGTVGITYLVRNTITTTTTGETLSKSGSVSVRDL